MIERILKRIGIGFICYLSAYFFEAYMQTKNVLFLGATFMLFIDALSVTLWHDKKKFEAVNKTTKDE